MKTKLIKFMSLLLAGAMFASLFPAAHAKEADSSCFAQSSEYGVLHETVEVLQKTRGAELRKLLDSSLLSSDPAQGWICLENSRARNNDHSGNDSAALSDERNHWAAAGIPQASLAMVRISHDNDAELAVYTSAGVFVNPVSDAGNVTTYQLNSGDTYRYVTTKEEFYHAAAGFTAEEGLTISASLPICEDWLTNIQTAINGTASSLSRNPYPMSPAFSPETHRYEIEVSDCNSSLGIWATSSRSGASISADYRRLSTGSTESKKITSGSVTGISLTGFIEVTGKSNRAVVRVTVEDGAVSYYQEYYLTACRKLHAYGISLSGDGEPILLSPEYDRDLLQYTATVNQAEDEIGLAVNLSSGNKDTDYTCRVQLGEYESVLPLSSVPTDLPLMLHSNLREETLRLTVENEDLSSIPTTYEIRIEKLQAIKAAFEVEPAHAVVRLEDRVTGRRIWPDDDGWYALMQGRNYTVVVTATGYCAKAMELTAAESNVYQIHLDSVEQDDTIPRDMESFWGGFRFDENNNAAVSAATPTSAESAVLYWANKLETAMIAQTVGNPILVDHTLVTFAGNILYKLDPMDGSILQAAQMAGSSPYATNSPAYAEGMIFVGLSDGRIQAFRADTLESLWLYTDPLGGQPAASISYHNGCIYTGFWNGETDTANFVCLTAVDENPDEPCEAKLAAWSYPWDGGYYLSGACVQDDCLIVGTDDGAAGYITGYASLLSLDPKTGRLLDCLQLPTVGDIRCAITYDAATDAFYFTSKGGYFNRVRVSEQGKFLEGSLQQLKLTNGAELKDAPPMSTATPLIYQGRAFIGVCGTAQFAPFSGHNISVLDLQSWRIAYTVPTRGYCQGSGLLTTTGDEDGTVHVYFFDNYQPGKLRMITDRPGQTAPAEMIREIYISSGKELTADAAYVLFTPYGAQAQYALCSPICDENGVIYFKNDSGHIMALGPTVERLELTEEPRCFYRPGETFDAAGLKVAAKYSNGISMDVSAYLSWSSAPLTVQDTELLTSFPHMMYQDRDGTAGQSVEAPYLVLPLHYAGEDEVRAADLVEGLIAALPQPITQENADLVAAALDAYNALSDAEKQLVRNVQILLDAIEALNLTPCEHEYGPWVSDNNGKHTRTCACGHYETKDCVLQWVTVADPGCTEPGTRQLICEICGWMQEQLAIPAAGHSWGEWFFDPEPTCDTEGIRTRTCQVCDATESEPAAAIGHQFGQWILVREGACGGQEGLERHVCELCGFAEERTVPAADHSWGLWSEENAPTCTEDGLRRRVCSQCGAEQQEAVPSLGHDELELPGTPATCKSPGLTPGAVCRRCGSTLTAQKVIPTFECPSAAMRDVGASAWYHNAVDDMIRRGVMSGVGQGKFEPTKTLSRAELVQVFFNMSGAEWTSTKTAFLDVSETAWYAKPVAWASTNGIVSGISKTAFGPKNPATREMVFTILFRYAGGEAVSEDNVRPFSDAGSVSKWAYDAVNWAVSNGYVKGAGNKLNPGNQISRAELAQLMSNYLQTS